MPTELIRTHLRYLESDAKTVRERAVIRAWITMIESDPALVEIIEENKKDELSQYRWDIIRVASELLQSLAQEVNVLGGDYPEEALFLAQENTHQRQ